MNWGTVFKFTECGNFYKIIIFVITKWQVLRIKNKYMFFENVKIAIISLLF